MERQAELHARQWTMALQAGAEWQEKLPEIHRTWNAVKRLGPRGADTPARVAKFVTREMQRSRAPLIDPSDPRFLGIERRFGPTLDYEYTPPKELAQAAGMSIARLVEASASSSAVSGFATGFMVSPRLLITNWHVFEDPSQAEGVRAQFGYEYRGVTLQDGMSFILRPDEFFYANSSLDFALVAVEPVNESGQVRRPFGYIPLIPNEGKILTGHPVNMIGYPDGMPKTYVSKNNPLIEVGVDTISYLTDSDGGSSGSGNFNNSWELIGLHHRAVPRMIGNDVQLKGGGVWTRGMSLEDIDWVANEGIRVSSIVRHLRDVQSSRPHPLLGELMSTAVDPVGNESADKSGALNMPLIDPKAIGGVQMTFTGAVTININTAPSAVNGTAAAEARAPADVPGVEANIRFDPAYDKRPGYLDTFLQGFTVRLPSASPQRKDEMLLEGGHELVLKYHHYSLAMNKNRRLQMWSAVNVDYDEAKRKWFKKRTAFGSDHWIPDPRIPAQFQLLGPEAYDPSKSLQRGHIVRRDDSAWGTGKTNQEYSNSDTFHWTNCTPQHGGFNESSYGVGDGTSYPGIWGGLENKIATLAKQADEAKLIVFGGPVLDANDDAYDWGYGPIQIPMKFWKVVLAVEGGELSSYGFVLDQTQAFTDLGFERLNFGEFEQYQEPIANIVALAGVEFDPQVLATDVMQGEASLKLEKTTPIKKKKPKP